VLAVVATGCGSVRKAVDNANNSAASYSDLQGFITDKLTTKFGRSVRSVSCTPHVQQVLLPGPRARREPAGHHAQRHAHPELTFRSVAGKKIMGR
jgi:hypothetical protein